MNDEYDWQVAEMRDELERARVRTAEDTKRISSLQHHAEKLEATLKANRQANDAAIDDLAAQLIKAENENERLRSVVKAVAEWLDIAWTSKEPIPPAMHRALAEKVTAVLSSR